MIIYNPHNELILQERMAEAREILQKIPAKYCFITGSFLHQEKYQDIDVFVLSRSAKPLIFKNKKIKVTRIDFNEMYSLFYHSSSKSCIAKNILLQRPLKVTLSDYWQIINETIPTLLNEKKNFHKNIRALILYTEYFKTREILDTFQLNEKVNSFQNYQKVMEYIKQEVPIIMTTQARFSYIKRFFYTQAAAYKGLLHYDAQKYLYELAHTIIRTFHHG